METDIILSNAVKAAYVNVLYNMDSISVVSDVLKALTQLRKIRRGYNKSFNFFKLRFTASVAKFYLNGESGKFSQLCIALKIISKEKKSIRLLKNYP